MLNALADKKHAEIFKDHPKGPTIIESKIKIYEDALALKYTSFPVMTSHENYKKCFQALLDMYRSGELDGSKVTHVCCGRVVKIDPEKPLLPYTIVDSPIHLQQHHCKASYGPRDGDGFHW